VTAVWVALIVALGALATTVLNGRQLRRSKQEDYARQDSVAAAAEERERLQSARQAAVARQAAEAARLLVADNEHRAEVLATANERIDGKLDQIHGLVNSTLTAAMTSELVALKAQLVMTHRVMALEHGEPTEAETTELIELDRRILELTAKLSDRARQTLIADAQVRK
jgi:hypothetical protein